MPTLNGWIAELQRRFFEDFGGRAADTGSMILELDIIGETGPGVVVHRNGPGVETPRCPITMD